MQGWRGVLPCWGRGPVWVSLGPLPDALFLSLRVLAPRCSSWPGGSVLFPPQTAAQRSPSASVILLKGFSGMFAPSLFRALEYFLSSYSFLEALWGF